MRSRIALLLLSMALLGCRGDGAAAVEVDDVRFGAAEVASLGPELLLSLADLTALGLAVAKGEAVQLGAPVVTRAGERARLGGLPLYLWAREAGLNEGRLAEFYARDPEWQLTVRHLVRLVPAAATTDAREEAAAEAEEAWRRAVGGEDFAALAAEYSEEPGAAQRGGLLEPARAGAWVEPFWQAALALAPGEISPVVETEYGYHVLQLETREPVPFEQADRTRVLAAAAPPHEAAQAMDRWAAWRVGALRVDAEALVRARHELERGGAPDTLVLASWPPPDGASGAPGRYTAADLAAFRASLDGEERERLDRLGDAAFTQRVEQDAQAAMLAEDARRLGVGVPRGAVAEAERSWAGLVARWSHALGLREQATPEEIRAAALRGVAARGQEQRIARLELEGIRPLLWSRYRVSGSALEPAAESSSPTP